MAEAEPIQAKVRKIGTSYGVIISKDYLDRRNIKEGDTILLKGIEPVKEVADIRGMIPGLTFEREHGTDRADRY